MSNLPPLYYINLINRQDRHKSFVHAWQYQFGFHLSHVKAIHYSVLPHSRSPLYTPKQLAQYATFLSHIKAVKRFLSSGFDLAWIAEDDAYPLFDQFFFAGHVYREIVNIRGLVNLAPNFSSWRSHPMQLNTVNSCMLYPHDSPPHCMHLYQLTREFAHKFLGYLYHITQTSDLLIYDVDIYMNAELRSQMYFMGACLAGQAPGYSDIESRNIDYRQQLYQSTPNVFLN